MAGELVLALMEQGPAIYGTMGRAMNSPPPLQQRSERDVPRPMKCPITRPPPYKVATLSKKGGYALT